MPKLRDDNRNSIGSIVIQNDTAEDSLLGCFNFL